MAVRCDRSQRHQRLTSIQEIDNGQGKTTPLKLRPLDDRVVVEPLEAEEKTAGGILLPDTAKQKPQRGQVARGRPRQAPRQRRPHRAGRARSATRSSSASTPATTSKSNGKEIKILRESDILAKVVK